MLGSWQLQFQALGPSAPPKAQAWPGPGMHKQERGNPACCGARLLTALPASNLCPVEGPQDPPRAPCCQSPCPEGAIPQPLVQGRCPVSLLELAQHSSHPPAPPHPWPHRQALYAALPQQPPQIIANNKVTKPHVTEEDVEVTLGARPSRSGCWPRCLPKRPAPTPPGSGPRRGPALWLRCTSIQPQPSPPSASDTTWSGLQR